MKALRIYTGPDNKSHYEDKDLELYLPGRGSTHSTPVDVKNISFIEGTKRLDFEWHNAPCRQYVIALDGQLELEIEDGGVRILQPGEVLIAEDTTGHGHISRHYNHIPGKPWRIAFIPFA